MSKAEMQRCRMHGDCFANRGGVCTCLKDNDFGGRDCPVFKPADTVRKEQRRRNGGMVHGDRKV